MDEYTIETVGPRPKRPKEIIVDPVFRRGKQEYYLCLVCGKERLRVNPGRPSRGVCRACMQSGDPRIIKERLFLGVEIAWISEQKLDSPCWLWVGTKDSGKRGRMRIKGEVYRVHRISALLWLGFDLDSALLVCHRCDQPSCVSPEHLFVGTNRDNVRDAIRKGRFPGGCGRKPGTVMVGLRGSLNPSAKLNEKQVMEIWRKLKEGRKKTHLAREYGVDAMVIHKISTGRNWGWLTGSLDLNVSEKTLDIP